LAHRTKAERRGIVAAIIAQEASEPLEKFELTDREENFFRARARRSLDHLASKTGTFRHYYKMPTEKPFAYVAGVVGLLVAFGVIAAAYILIRGRGDPEHFPLLAACGTVVVAAIGSGLAAWIAHRNMVRQNTTNIIFTRFAQTAFGDAMHRFHRAFGHEISDKVSMDRVKILRMSINEDDQRSAESVNYLLNYYEFIAGGVIKGDLHPKIVRRNLRGVICYYYDKCEAYILAANQRNRRAFSNLMKLRAHYREP
jgi:hypothetical protein